MRQPNVIVILTDQQRWDSTGLHGNPLGLTPNFDRMAREGTHLAHAVSTNPVCGPARAALQTGCYPTTSGCVRNGIPLPTDAVTLAHLFGDAGYATGYIGKWHLADIDEAGRGPVRVEQRGGYQYWLAANALEFTSHAYHTVVYDDDGQPVELPGYRVDALTDAAIRYVADHRHEPFYLNLSLLEPHQQNTSGDYQAPDGYRERYEGRWTPPDLATLHGNAHQHLGGYWGMVARLDEALGRLRDALKSMSLSGDTILLFTSDHGCHFGTRDGEYKRSPHEASIRVPAALTGSVFTGGGRIDRQVSTIDLAPTLLEAAGIAIPDHLEGRSVVPLVQRTDLEWPDDVLIQFDAGRIGRAVRTNRWKYAVLAPGPPSFDPSLPAHFVEEFLYDLRADPYELSNLAGMRSHRHVADVMRTRLHNLMATAGEPETAIMAPAERDSGQLRLSDGEEWE